MVLATGPHESGLFATRICNSLVIYVSSSNVGTWKLLDTTNSSSRFTGIRKKKWKVSYYIRGYAHKDNWCTLCAGEMLNFIAHFKRNSAFICDRISYVLLYILKSIWFV